MKIALVALGLSVVLLLSGCSTRESFETATPAALTASDLGITYAEADTRTSGFAVYMSIYVEFDHSTVSAKDLRQIIKICVENNTVGGLYGLTISAVDGPIDVEYKPIDLAAASEELGFPEHSSAPGDFYAKWDDVVDFIEN